MKQLKPDSLSIEFMSFSRNYIRNRRQYEDMVMDILAQTQDKLLQPTSVIENKLMPKLYNGSLEHGKPIHPLNWIVDEFEKEIIDMIGYSLLWIWNNERNKQSKK